MTTESADSATLQALLAEQKKIVALPEAGRDTQQEALRYLQEPTVTPKYVTGRSRCSAVPSNAYANSVTWCCRWLPCAWD